MDEKKLWDIYGNLQKESELKLGNYYSYQFINSRRHLLYTISRYKFAMKMIGDNKKILELGCNEGIGTYFLSEYSSKSKGGGVTGVDFDENSIHWAKEQEILKDIDFKNDNFLGKVYGSFNAIVSFDVIEHIYPENENLFMETVIKNLLDDGIFIVGTPSLESQQYSNKDIMGAHVNVYTGERLRDTLNQYFNNVFMFTQNDEVIHTGHFRMANYLLALCCYKRQI